MRLDIVLTQEGVTGKVDEQKEADRHKRLVAYAGSAAHSAGHVGMGVRPGPGGAEAKATLMSPSRSGEVRLHGMRVHQLRQVDGFMCVCGGGVLDQPCGPYHPGGGRSGG